MPGEQELLRLCLLNQAQAQYILYDRYVTAMFNVALRVLGSVPEAEDVVQESFVKVFQHLSHFRGDSTLGAWIRRIVLTTALTRLRILKRLQFEPLEAKYATAMEDTGEETPAWDAQTLHRAIQALPEGCRVVFVLFALEEMSHKEIAQNLGVSESTSKTQYMRAKKLLREHLVKHTLKLV
jgi:RNA polymerase sigma factor (sigma-70 family)